MNPGIDLPPHDAVQAALVRCGVGIDAAELHGLVTGYIAAGASLDGDDWLARLHVDADNVMARADTTLDALRGSSATMLADQDMGFALLQPADDAPLGERIAALFAWCRGFLAGFSLAPNRPALSDDAQEAFADLANIAGFVVDDDDQDEQALMEIAEFARVAVLLIHGDALISRRDSGRLH
ncbi:UPF0149 family protein [Xanthomonadaceae bacterium JHOS43]|nr:UPF0149 family protein [Xanthomonadaceae bacterium JHOS43]MCX7564091.1 UPF0149 family protein [Xanthomonadaceae bacterium XH05]